MLEPDDVFERQLASSTDQPDAELGSEGKRRGLEVGISVGGIDRLPDIGEVR
jgi:hypothetical protein